MSSRAGPFLHKASNRFCWWSEQRQCYVFEDGTAVPTTASAEPNSVVRPNPSPASPSNDNRAPRFIPPQDPPPSSSSPDRTLRTAPSIPAIAWKKWRQGQTFGRGDTVHFQVGRGEPPITRGNLLGSGMYATVFAVRMDDTNDVCAMKVYKSPHALATFREKFEREIHNLRRVSNRHIASFYAAYIYERKTQAPEYGMLMQPVATSGTLEQVISTCRAAPSKVTKQTKDALARAFGCLSSALDFVHQHMIRHKDVKPDNILIHEGKVLLADFGSSWDGWSTRSLVTQNPNPQGHTPRYAAPEVMSGDPRSGKSDIFSLGGVFYEIFCALEPEARWHEEEYYRIITRLQNSLVAWRSNLPEVIPLISRMLEAQQVRRPSARDLVATLSASYFCPNCCQDHQKVSSGQRPSASGKQPEQMMAQLTLQQPRESATAAPSIVRRASAPPSAPPTSHKQMTAHTYASSSSRESRVEEEEEDDDDDDDDDDEDEDEDEESSDEE